MPFLLLGAVTAFWLMLPAQAPESLDSGSRLYAALLGLFGGQVKLLQILGSVLLAGAAMSLARPLLPAKAPASAIASARSLILLSLVIPLHPWLVESFRGSAVTLSMACMFASWSIALLAMRGGRGHLPGLTGLLAALGVSLSLFAAAGLPPLAILILLHIRKTGKKALGGLGLFLLGLLTGLLPEWNTFAQRLMALQNFDPSHPLLSIQNTHTELGIAGILFLALALLVGILQKQSLILGLLIPCWLLQKLLLGFSGTPTRLLGAAMLIPALLYGYGVFRIVRGLETGLQSVNPRSAKAVMRLTPPLLLLAFSFWAWRQFG